MKKEIQNLIVEGSKLAWESYKLEPYVQRCLEAFTRYNENVRLCFVFCEIYFFIFHFQVDEIVRLDTTMFTYIDELDKCKYAYEIFQEFLSEIQKIVDEFCLHDYSNILKWIGVIDGKIERILFERLQAAMNLWKQALVRQEKGKVKEKKRMRLKVN